MKVLLAYPFREDTYRKVGFILPPLGIAYIASLLRDSGHEVKIADFNVTDESVDYTAFDIVGISADTSRYKSGLMLAKDAKNAGCTVVMGGPHVSYRDEDTLRTGFCDFVVREEGEQTMLELANTVGTEQVYSVRGISYLRDGNIQRTPSRGFIDNIDDLVPARDLLNMGAYRHLEMGKRKMTSILTSRGCPFGCSFCCSTEFSGRKWRSRSPLKIVDEIEDVVANHDFNGIAFLDDNFTLDPNRVIAICDEIMRRKIDIYWWCFSRADTLLNNEAMIARMAEAGCKYIFIGFESQNQGTLDQYHKNITDTMAGEVTELLRKYNISVHASFIIGNIDETREMVMDTVRYAREIDPQAVQFTILTPYPGTKLFDEVKERIITYDWDLYDCLHSVVRTDHLGQKELEALLKKAYLSFYLSPRKIAAGIMSGFRGKGIKLSSILRIFRGL
ncbi:MAG: cobalamin B12-binding domain-containing protein [Nitrospirae bacterium]|nr:cobalamin B12-binding domain-containing protein [Nitrospirota bacterium]